MVSSLGTVYKQRNNPDYASLGASGAILAVLFAYIVYYPTQHAVPVLRDSRSRRCCSPFGYLAYTLVGVEALARTASTTTRISTARSSG